MTGSAGSFWSRWKENSKKITWLKLNIIAVFRLLQIPTAYFAPPCESIFAETVNRTTMFLVRLRVKPDSLCGMRAQLICELLIRNESSPRPAVAIRA